MRYRVLAAIGMLWGAGILFFYVAGFSRGAEPAGAAYAAGEYIGMIIGFLMLAGGLYFLIKTSKD
jgi:hypothetical protein